METQRREAISAMASAAAFDGWANDNAATHAADALQIPVLRFRRLTGKTPRERLSSYFELLGARMGDAVSSPDSLFTDMRVRAKIGFLIFTRLRACEADENGKEALRQASGYLANPFNIAFALNAQFNAADAIWRAAGDTSTDFNYYSKRTLAGGVYAASLLYYLDDASDDAVDTRAFIDRRIDNVMQIEKGKSAAKNAFPDLCKKFGL